MNWELLGITPTVDKNAITAAYRAKLVQVNPEDKPEEFMALRQAYEQALKYAQEQSAAPDTSPLGIWTDRLRRIYDHFPSRIDPAAWQELLFDELCHGLDTRAAVEDALLHFLMEDYLIPQEIWQLLDDTFHLEERQEELCQEYPRNFIEYAVLNGIHLLPTLPYHLFTPGENGKKCDAYLRLYQQMQDSAGEERTQLLSQLKEMPEQHPYGDAAACLMEIHEGDTEAGFSGLKALAERYPEDPMLNQHLAQEYLARNDPDQAEAIARAMLECNPSNRVGTLLLADSHALRGEFEKAKQLLIDLFSAADTDRLQTVPLQERIRQWNEQLIAQLEQQLAEHPGDSETARKLSWSYLQNEDLQNAERVAANMDPEKETVFDYHNLMGKILYALERKEEALEHFLILENLLTQASQDPGHPAAEHAGRLPEFVQMSGDCMLSQGREQEALEKFEYSLELAPENTSVLDHMGRLLMHREDYVRAVEMFLRMTKLNPRSHYGYTMACICYDNMNRDPEAFDAVNRALNLESRDLTLYILKMRILLRNGVWEEVRNIIDFLTQSGVADDISVDWCKAQLLDLAEEKPEEALRAYQSILDRVQQGQDFLWVDEIYFRIAVLRAQKLNIADPSECRKLLDILDKGIKYNPSSECCLDYKAWILWRTGKTDEALEIYHRLEKKQGHTSRVEQGLGRIYFSRNDLHAEKALHYYSFLLEDHDTPENHYYAAACLRLMGRYTEAREHYLREVELDSVDVDGYAGLAKLHMLRCDNALALAELNRGLEAIADIEGNYTWLCVQKAQVLTRMNDVDAALQTMEEAWKRYGDPLALQTVFEVSCQFGRWDRAKNALDRWIKAAGKNEKNGIASVMLSLYQGKMMRATVAFAGAAGRIGAYETDTLKMQVAALEGNPERSLRVWTKRSLEDPQDSDVLSNLAHAQWLTGRTEEAKLTAQQALDALDETLKGYLDCAALYRSQRIRLLAILGKEQEAREELAAVRAMPLCDHCTYSRCKDADIFEAQLEEILGNRAEALKLYQSFAAQWPDELDFPAGAARIRKKGK